MKALVLKGIVLIVLTLFLGCNENRGRRVVDRAGIEVVVRQPVNRIISTAPSNTEIIVDLGMAHKLVAVDRHSANAAGIPDNLPLLDFFFPDAEVIIMLEPDLIVASGHNPTGSGEDPFRLLRQVGIPVVFIPMSRSINDIYEDIMFIAGLLQAEQEGKALIAAMQEEIEEIAQAAIQSLKGRKLTVYFEISTAPDMMTFGAGSFINDMIFTIGMQNIFKNDNWLVMPSAEVIIERNPDIIFTNVNWVDDPIAEIKSRPGFNHINAVINNRIYLIDNDASSRSSARIVTALRQMAEALPVN